MKKGLLIFFLGLGLGLRSSFFIVKPMDQSELNTLRQEVSLKVFSQAQFQAA